MLGLFFAPTILFYSITGALQTLELHESHDGYKPTELIMRFAQVHKHQTFDMPAPKKPKESANPPRTGTVTGADANTQTSTGSDASIGTAAATAIGNGAGAQTRTAIGTTADTSATDQQNSITENAHQNKTIEIPNSPKPKLHRSVLFMWFATLLSIGLSCTTLLGIYMAFKYKHDKQMIISLLVLGTVLPALLLRL